MPTIVRNDRRYNERSRILRFLGENYFEGRNNIWFTANTNFCMKSMKKKRKQFKFATYIEHDDFFLERWNDTVKEHDVVFHLGDFAHSIMGVTRVGIKMFQKLKGKKYLVRGTLDTYFGAYVKCFTRVFDRLDLCMRDYRELHGKRFKYLHFSLYHYPLVHWYLKDRGAINLHASFPGKNISYDESRIDIGLDNNNYHLVPFADILKRIDERQNSAELKKKMPQRLPTVR